VERIFKHRIRQQIDTNDMQFGFMKGKGSTDAIFYCKTDAGKVYSQKEEALFWLCGFGKSL